MKNILKNFPQTDSLISWRRQSATPHQRSSYLTVLSRNRRSATHVAVKPAEYGSIWCDELSRETMNINLRNKLLLAEIYATGHCYWTLGGASSSLRAISTPALSSLTLIYGVWLGDELLSIVRVDYLVLLSVNRDRWKFNKMNFPSLLLTCRGTANCIIIAQTNFWTTNRYKT